MITIGLVVLKLEKGKMLTHDGRPKIDEAQLTMNDNGQRQIAIGRKNDSGDLTSYFTDEESAII